MLNEKLILLNRKYKSANDAIKSVGDLFVKYGYTAPEYTDSMIERNNKVSVYIGNNIAIPHGSDGSDQFVKKTGLAIIQVPNGVTFGEGNIAKILIGISSKGSDHLEILSKIAVFCSKQDNVDKLVNADSKEEIIELLKQHL